MKTTIEQRLSKLNKKIYYKEFNTKFQPLPPSNNWLKMHGYPKMSKQNREKIKLNNMLSFQKHLFAYIMLDWE